MQLAHVAVGRAEELRVEDFLDVHEGHYRRPRHWARIERGQRTKVQIDLIEVSQYLTLIREEHCVTPPAIGAEFLEFFRVVAIPEEDVLVLVVVLQKLTEES